MFYNKTNKGVYLYRGKLKKLGWLKQTSEGLKIPDQFAKLKGFDSVNYSIKINAKKNESSEENSREKEREG